MEDYLTKDYKVFEMFQSGWAIVSSGNINDFGCCTIAWGSLGTIWTRPNCPKGQVVTVYIHPGRYTLKYLKENDTFTLSFFCEEYRKALSYIGTHSSRNENKVAKAGLTPLRLENSVGFAEARMSFVCRKIYLHQMCKDDIAEDVAAYYKSRPEVYPRDEKGEWQPHYAIIGEIIKAEEKQI